MSPLSGEKPASETRHFRSSFSMKQDEEKKEEHKKWNWVRDREREDHLAFRPHSDFCFNTKLTYHTPGRSSWCFSLRHVIIAATDVLHLFSSETHMKKSIKNSLVRSLSRAVPTYLYHTTTTSTFRYIFALPWISRCNTTCIVCFHVRICSRWAEKTLAEFRSRTLSRSGCFVRTTTYTSSDPAHGVSSKTVSYCSPQLKPRYIHFHSSFVVSSLSRFFSLSISFHDKLAILFIVFQIASLKPILRHLSVSQWYKMNPFSYVFKIVTKTDMVYPCSSSSDNILWLFRPELQ